MTHKPTQGAAASGISTKAELLQRLAARPKPRTELHLTPSGPITQTVHQHINQSAEQRIKHLKSRLGDAKDRLSQHRRGAVHRGRAKGDFERSR